MPAQHDFLFALHFSISLKDYQTGLVTLSLISSPLQMKQEWWIFPQLTNTISLTKNITY